MYEAKQMLTHFSDWYLQFGTLELLYHSLHLPCTQCPFLLLQSVRWPHPLFTATWNLKLPKHPRVSTAHCHCIIKNLKIWQPRPYQGWVIFQATAISSCTLSSQLYLELQLPSTPWLCNAPAVLHAFNLQLASPRTCFLPCTPLNLRFDHLSSSTLETC